MNRSRLTAELIILFKGHIFNSLFQSRKDRRRKRGQVKVDVIGKYLGTLKPVICSVEEDPPLSDESEERIFSIWLQGEDNAPDIVRACYRSIRANCTQRLVVLDGTTIWDWIELPDHIVSKWKSGKIKPAHFADICRVELLYRVSGLMLLILSHGHFPNGFWEKIFSYILLEMTLQGHTLSYKTAFSEPGGTIIF